MRPRLLPLLGDQIIVIIRNITHERSPEEALKESDTRPGKHHPGIAHPHLCDCNDHQVIYWNNALEELTQLKAAEMVGAAATGPPSIPRNGPCLRRPSGGRGPRRHHPLVRRQAPRISGLIDVAIEIADSSRPGEKGSAALHGGGVSGFPALPGRGHQHDRRRHRPQLREEKYGVSLKMPLTESFRPPPTGASSTPTPAFAYPSLTTPPKNYVTASAILLMNYMSITNARRELLDLVEKQGWFVISRSNISGRTKCRRVNLSLRAVRNSMGQMLYLEGTAQDITERKSLKPGCCKVQKMETIGTLAGGIAHDFNNILAAIVGYTEIAKSRLRQKELSTYLDRVLDASERARDLVGQILTFSRSAAQELRPIDLASVTQEALGLLRATIPSTIIIHHRIASELNAVLADPTQIHQVLINLCTNSAQAMREKGGMIQVTVENVELTPRDGGGDGG